MNTVVRTMRSCTTRGRRRRAAAAVLALSSAALVIGGVATSEAVTSVTGYKYQSTPALVAAAKRAALKDAAAAGKPTKLPAHKKIGLILLSGTSATSQRVVVATHQIAKLLGYTTIVCDPGFDATKVPACATSIVAQNPSMIISVSTNPGEFGSALATAAQRHILWFDVGSGITPSADIANYGEPGPPLAHALDKWLFKTMAARANPGSKLDIMALTAPTVGISSSGAEGTLLKDVKNNPRVDLVVNHNLDLTNIVQDTLNTTTQTAQQFPSLAGTWTVCDVCIPLMAQAFTTAGLTGANRPVVAGEYSTPQTVADIRAGSVNGVADYPWEVQVWTAVDQALEHWARGKPIVQNFSVFGKYGLKFMTPYVITPSSAGKSGPAPIYGSDFQSYFETKWQKEFGIAK